MNSTIWETLTPRHPRPMPPAPEERDPRRYRKTAPHIRGRVFLMRVGNRRTLPLWGMQVINTRTGKILASDNCTIHSKIVEECDQATAAARAAWFWGFKHKAAK